MLLEEPLSSHSYDISWCNLNPESFMEADNLLTDTA